MEICQATAGVIETEKFEQLHYMMTYTQQVCVCVCVCGLQNLLNRLM